MVDFTGLLGVPSHSCSSGATDPILSTQRIPRWGDPSGGGLRIVSGGAWGDNRGTMRQKMTIFKEETAFAGVQKIFQELSFHILNEK